MAGDERAEQAVSSLCCSGELVPGTLQVEPHACGRRRGRRLRPVNGSGAAHLVVDGPRVARGGQILPVPAPAVTSAFTFAAGSVVYW
ncbi:hypothetical protein J2S66_003403 [Saccharothrix longispora]|uniref:Uncharacterized protein n=1 Tax=Saccharothrix longispora TaxID=33920 RepID=A0ABU1PYR2_9PSEU|nr:hypothetical protein [Saccharothrix longispora]MDR6595019.1 hypothetical protein [Saccharothrix longispora]